MNTVLRQIQTANSGHYVNSSEIDSYLTKRHHKTRLELSSDLLHSALTSAFSVSELRNASILDIGASAGQMSKLLTTSGFRVIASDIEHSPLVAAKAAVFSCVQFDAACGLPFGDSILHAIFMGEIIEHVFDTRLLLSECYRVLKKGGVLVVTTPNLAGLQDRLKFLFGKAPRNVNPLHEYLNLHIRPFTYGLLRDSVESAGFVIIKLLSNYVRWEVYPNTWLDLRLPARLFPTLGSNLIVACQKR